MLWWRRISQREPQEHECDLCQAFFSLANSLGCEASSICLLLTQHGNPSVIHLSVVNAFLRLMHSFLRLRHSSILSTGASIMETVSYRGATYDYLFESSASSPSLRASEPTTPAYSTMANGADGDGAGNVKVVVRVRQFVQRGTHHVSHIRFHG